MTRARGTTTPRLQPLSPLGLYEEGWGALRDCRYLLHDRDTKFTRSFRAIIASGRVEPLALPVHSPDLNCPRCFSSVSAPCGWRRANMLRITMRSVIIRGRTTSCYFLVTRKRDAAGLCNVAKGWAGFCIIIIKKPRNLAENSRMILWLEVDCTCARTGQAGAASM
jgi:hypothetical protein